MNEYMTVTNCATCGKEFVPAALNIYKKNGRQYCSWTCYEHRNDKPNIDYEHKLIAFLRIRLTSETNKYMCYIRKQLEDNGINIVNYYRAGRVIETNKVVVILIPESKRRAIRSFCDEAFGFTPTEKLEIRKYPERQPYEGGLIKYILEKEK